MDNKKFFPFADFIGNHRAQEFEDFTKMPGTKVLDNDEFEKMKDHINKHYENVDVQNSFIDESGQIWDCIPMSQQPSIKGSDHQIAQAPDLPIQKNKNTGNINYAKPQLSDDKIDKFGNTMCCPNGTIPIRRITLEEMTRFETLQKFLHKGPKSKSSANPKEVLPEVAAQHKYAHAYQNINNLGGHSFLNIWQPAVTGDQIFSLCQHWYVGGSGSSLQTAEAGWQVYPQKYGNANPCLFIYWTADNYQNSGNYNHEGNGPGFVQTNPNWTLGGSLNPVSVDGGEQHELELSWFLTNGNWWLYINGSDAANAIGYYPASIYNDGQLSTCANVIDYGGETVGNTTWPQMGSGKFADVGATHAAYQRNIYLFLEDGTTQPANLNGSQDWATNYTINIGSNEAWGTYFYYGGPGGI